MSFKSLGLSSALLKAIAKKGYTTPSPIQEKAIPLILKQRDVMASAQTGTGKTAGFTLPLLQLLAQNIAHGRQRPIRALILTPTRELAAQVYDNIRAYSKFLALRSTVIFGGVNAKPQIRTLRQGVDILVATPGRLLDLETQNHISLSNIEILVLDEADRMLDMGFLRDIKKVLHLVPNKRQNLLFSATFSKDIKQLANSIMHHPVSVEAAPENTTAEKVAQKIYRIDKSKKTAAVTQLIGDGHWKQVLIFMRTKHGANRLAEKLNKKSITAAAIHGNKTQNARTKALSGFKKGTIRVLVATDIAARGLDIPLLPHVINFELPNVPEDYVHRIGRTGRAGASGEAISLVSNEEQAYVKGIEKLLQQKLPHEVLKGFELTVPFDENLPAPKKQQGKSKSYKSNSRRSHPNKGRKPRNRNSNSNQK